MERQQVVKATTQVREEDSFWRAGVCLRIFEPFSRS